MGDQPPTQWAVTSLREGSFVFLVLCRGLDVGQMEMVPTLSRLILSDRRSSSLYVVNSTVNVTKDNGDYGGRMAPPVIKLEAAVNVSAVRSTVNPYTG